MSPIGKELFAMAWLRLFVDRRAVTALEYGLIASIIFGTVLVGFGLMATDLSNSFAHVGTCVQNGPTDPSCQ
jgi:Flp pilus assembly pilin Flp